MYTLAASAAGVSLLALTQPSEAKIVYTPAHRQLPLNKDFFLDLNHDGVADFKFHIFTFDHSVRRGTGSMFDYALLMVYPQGTANHVVGKSTYYASALRYGVRIGPKAPFARGRALMGGVQYHFANKTLIYSGPWASNGKAVNHRYLGLEFVVKGQIHFGWARFNVRVYRNPEAIIFAILTGYAYETIPNRPITAGKTMGPDDASAEEPNATLTAPTPEPATLGVLAMGAPGLPIWKREESVVATTERH
jgi:hypothetical protein